MSRTTPDGQIDFYFDFTSPYSWLAHAELEAIAARYGQQVNYIPVLLGILFRQTGAVALTSQHPWKAEYFLGDFARSAEFRGLPYRQPSVFPQPSQSAARILIWLQQTAPDKVAPFAAAVFRLLFEENGNIQDLDALARIGRELGIDEIGLRAAPSDDAIKARFVANTEDAAARQVFGAPTFFLGAEQFWGNDRLPQLEWRLSQRAGGRNHRVLVDAANAKIETLTAEQAIAEFGKPGVVFVDIRDPRELERDGLVEGAVHAPRGMVEFWVDPASPYYRDAFTADKRYIFYCAGGLRSALTTAAVADMGVLPDIAHIDGGFAAWKEAGGPITAREPR